MRDSGRSYSHHSTRISCCKIIPRRSLQRPAPGGDPAARPSGSRTPLGVWSHSPWNRHGSGAHPNNSFWQRSPVGLLPRAEAAVPGAMPTDPIGTRHPALGTRALTFDPPAEPLASRTSPSILLVVVSFALASVACAPTRPATETDAAAANARIDSLNARLVDAYRRRDPAAYAALYT